MPNSKQIQQLNFCLIRKRKKSFYSELHALQKTEAGFSIFIYLKKRLFLAKNVVTFLTIYIIISDGKKTVFLLRAFLVKKNFFFF